MQYSFHDLQSHFGPDVLQDAAYYLEQGLVALPDIRRDGRLITSLLRSPGKPPYRIYIRIEKDSGSTPRSEASAAAPAGSTVLT